MDTDIDIDDVLRRRFWLKQNFEWFMNEVIFHKDMRPYFSERKYVVWNLGEPEGKVKIETASRSDEV